MDHVRYQSPTMSGATLRRRMAAVADLSRSLSGLGALHAEQIRATHGDAGREAARRLRGIWADRTAGPPLLRAWAEYATDFAQRAVLFTDIMREVGNQFNEQMAGGGSMVLIYDYEMIVDGRQLARPVNYALVRIIPPEGVAVDAASRPYMIIDPRAGHGPGIGGFKTDSEVGVALAHGHPVYFTIFFREPEAGQTLADVCAAEGIFVRAIAERHPAAPKPAVIGNCQGGWAAMLMAASNPHVSGPLVLNGAPLSYWAGVRGKNPMRYNGGLSGGAMPALLLSDLGNGRFDGANLVLNFEQMNPGNTWWMKYYTVFANADTEGPRFKGFEKWWSSFYFMNEAEIRWIVENLFIGNKLQRGEAVLGGRGPVDLHQIRSPIIVFASEGDDITPPPQALAWIAAVYADEREIRARGQTIIYIVHHDIGHLGIFVSAKVALKEHDRIVTMVDAVEALAPGLYEMHIDKVADGNDRFHYTVDFEARTMADLRVRIGGQDDDVPFGVVARVSETLVDNYEMLVRPVVKAVVTPAFAEAMARTHPLRARRELLSDHNPLMLPVASLAASVRASRQPAAKDNPFLLSEALVAGMIGRTMDFLRDLKTARDEMMFFAIYANPMLAWLARHPDPTPNGAGPDATLRELPEVQHVLRHVADGGFAEAVIRMLVLMAHSRGAVRQSRLQRANEILHNAEPFRGLSSDRRKRIIREQTLVVDVAPDAAIETLPELLPQPAERQRAIALVEQIAGDPAEMSEPTVRMLARLRAALPVAPTPRKAATKAADVSEDAL